MYFEKLFGVVEMSSFLFYAGFTLAAMIASILVNMWLVGRRRAQIEASFDKRIALNLAKVTVLDAIVSAGLVAQNRADFLIRYRQSVSTVQMDYRIYDDEDFSDAFNAYLQDTDAKVATVLRAYSEMEK